MRRAFTALPGAGRTVTGVAVGAVLAAGLAVNVAQAAPYTCPTFTDPSGDTTQPAEPDVDLTAVTYTVVDGRFKAVLLLAGLSDSGPQLGTGDIFRTTFTVAGKNASFSVQRTTFPSESFTTTATLGSTALTTKSSDFDIAKKTVTLSASVDEMETAAGVPLVGEAFSAMKASTATVPSSLPENFATTDTATAPAAAAYVFGDTCADPGSTESPSTDPSSTESPTAEPTDSSSPSETPSESPSASPTAGTGSGGYVAMPTPVRVVDTRPGSRVGTTTGPVGGSMTFSLAGQITGTATAAVLNVTSVGSNAAGNLVVHRSAISDPGTSGLNWAKGVTQANEVTSALDATKSLTIDVHSRGTTHIVVDLVGYITDDTNVAEAGLVALRTPERVFDRTIEEGATTITLQPSQLRTGTTGVRVNVTLVKPATSTYLAVYPGDRERPDTSTVNAATGATQSNETFVRLSADRTFKVDLGLGVARVVVDLLGTYGAPVTNAGTIVPIEKPERLVDTRTGLGAPAGKRTDGSSLAVPLGTLPEGVVGVVLSVTSTGANDKGFVTVHPGGTSRPGTSTLNLTSKSDRAHQVVVGRGTGNPLASVAGGGTTHLVVDLVGYVLTPGTASPSPSPSQSVDPSASPSESVDPSASPSESVDPSASPSESVDPSASPSATPTSSASPTPSPTATCPLGPLC